MSAIRQTPTTKRRLSAAALVVTLVSGACGSDDSPDSEPPEEQFEFVDTGWFTETSNPALVGHSEVHLLDSSCDLRRSIPVGSQHTVVSADGASFVRNVYPDGTWGSDAALQGPVIIASIEQGEWHVTQAAPFTLALSAQRLPPLDGVVPKKISESPFHSITEWDLALRIAISADDLIEQQAAAAEIVDALIGESPAAIRSGTDVVWTRWWSEGELVAEQRMTPIEDACIFQASSFAAATVDVGGAIASAEAIFDLELASVMQAAEATLNSGGPSDGPSGLRSTSAGDRLPHQLIPLPTPGTGGGSGRAAQSLTSAASSAATASQSYRASGGAAGLRTALGYVGMIARAVSLINSFMTIGDAMTDALSGKSGANSIFDDIETLDTSGGTNESPQINPYVPAPKSLPAFPGATVVPSKTPVQGGGHLRKRWKDSKGRIYEWDYKKGEVEIYDKSGKNHKGGFDPETGEQKSDAKPDRKVKKRSKGRESDSTPEPD